MTPLELYFQFFPHSFPTCYQQSLLEEYVVDMDRWRRTLEFWAGNDFRAQSILKMIGYYNDLEVKDKAETAQRENKFPTDISLLLQ